MAQIAAHIAARMHGGHQGTINRIVMHSTVSPCKPGWARRIAQMFHTTSRYASAHFVVDCDEVIRCLPDDVIAYHAPPNAGSIGIEQCDWSKGGKSRWFGGNHAAMLLLSADRAAKQAAKHDVPLQWLSPADLRAGKRGITSHWNVTQAWHQTTHTDPDDFPYKHFMNLVRGGGDDMPSAKDVAEEVWKYQIESGNKQNPEWAAKTFIKNIEDGNDKVNQKLNDLAGKLEAQAATIDKLVDAVAVGGQVDVGALKAEIRAAIESVQVRLTTTTTTSGE